MDQSALSRSALPRRRPAVVSPCIKYDCNGKTKKFGYLQDEVGRSPIGLILEPNPMASIQLSDNSWFGWNMIVLFRPLAICRSSPNRPVSQMQILRLEDYKAATGNLTNRPIPVNRDVLSNGKFRLIIAHSYYLIGLARVQTRRGLLDVDSKVKDYIANST